MFVDPGSGRVGSPRSSRRSKGGKAWSSSTPKRRKRNSSQIPKARKPSLYDFFSPLRMPGMNVSRNEYNRMSSRQKRDLAEANSRAYSRWARQFRI